MDKEIKQIDELSTDKLAQYKKKAGEDASAADSRGDYKRGNKRFAGIIKATKKQFKNELKETQLDKDGYPIIQAGSEDVPVKPQKGPKMTKKSEVGIDEAIKASLTKWKYNTSTRFAVIPQNVKQERGSQDATTFPLHKYADAKAHAEKTGGKLVKVDNAGKIVEELDTPQIRALRAIMEAKKVAAEPAAKDDTPPKFKNVFCSQCGQKFGPGNSGFSSCKEHRKAKIFAIPEEVELEESFEDAEQHKVAAEKAKAKGNMGAFHAHMANHHEAMAEWNASKGRHSVADKHAEKAEEHHEASLKHPYVKEEFEQIDEISKQVLGSYVKKASKNLANTAAVSRDFASGSSQFHQQLSDKLARKAMSRSRNIDKAVDRLAKEGYMDDLSSRFTESVQHYIAGQIDDIALDSIAIQVAEAVAIEKGISLEQSYNIAVAYVEEMLEESNAKFQDRMQSYVQAVNSNAKYDSEKFEEARDWGSMSKRQFKYAEMEHELRNEVGPKKSSYAPRKSYSSSTPQTKIYHKVPYAQKEDAKKEGMRWDPDSKKWYHSDHAKSSASKFQKEEVEIGEATKGDKEHTALQKFMAARRLKQAEKSGTKKSQDWYNKQASKKNLPEEVEQIDELKKSTVKSYIKKASHSVADNAWVAGTAQSHVPGETEKLRAKAFGKANKRIAGIARAADRLAKEEVELDEAQTPSALDRYKALKDKLKSQPKDQQRDAQLKRINQTIRRHKAKMSEEVELDEAIPYALSAANFNASRHQDNYKGTVTVPLKHVGGTPDYKAIKKHVASKGLKVHSIGTGDGYKTVTLASNDHTAAELKSKLGINEEVEQIDEMQQGKSYTQDQLKKKIQSGSWEAVTDIKPGKTVEMRHHTGKRVMVQVKEEVHLDEGSDYAVTATWTHRKYQTEPTTVTHRVKAKSPEHAMELTKKHLWKDYERKVHKMSVKPYTGQPTAGGHIKEESETSSPMDLYLEALQTNPSILK